MKYDKLVRDRIPEILKEKGVQHTTHIASDEEYSIKLKAKLQEEVAEFVEEPNGDELTDILEVVYALSEQLNIDRSELEKLRKEKAEKRGGFKDKIILDESK